MEFSGQSLYGDHLLRLPRHPRCTHTPCAKHHLHPLPDQRRCSDPPAKDPQGRTRDVGDREGEKTGREEEKNRGEGEKTGREEKTGQEEIEGEGERCHAPQNRSWSRRAALQSRPDAPSWGREA